MMYFFGTMFFLMGLCFGSFVNMLVYRTAIKYKLLKLKRADTGVRSYNSSRSYCDYCGRQLTWRENIPVVSWLVQKGKTRCCHKKLSSLYPVVELGLGILFLFNFWFYKTISWEMIIVFLILVFLWFSAVFDLRYYILPDFSTIIILGLSVLLNYQKIIGSAIAGLIGLCFFWLLSKIKIRGQEAMGGGDVKLALVMGIMLGLPKMIVAFYVAFIVGSIISLILMITKRINKTSTVPFGPFLILGILTSWYYGDWLLNILM